MKTLHNLILLALAAGATAWAADVPKPAAGKVLDGQLRMIESEIVPLAEAMPAEKYSFAPTAGEFSGVRTFAQQVTHVSFVIYACSASVLGEKNPSETDKSENGPPSLKTKEQIVRYLKDAFAYGHKAMAGVTDQNLTEMVQSAFGNSKTARLNMATVPVWHTFDHYGQMVVYARMNGIIPPASRK